MNISASRTYRFMENNYLAIGLLIVFFWLSVFSVSGNPFADLKKTGDALTTDEVVHLASGYYYLKTGRYFLNPEHPPLVKDIAALPLVFMNPRLPQIDEAQQNNEWSEIDEATITGENFPQAYETENRQLLYSNLFLYNMDNDADLMAFWAHASVAFANTCCLFFIYLYIKKLWSKKAALIALTLVVFNPLVLAHGSLVTTDVMSALLQLLTVLAFSVYLKSIHSTTGNTKHFIRTGVFLSLACLAKFSSVVLIGVLFCGGLIYLLQKMGARFTVAYYLVRYLMLVVFCILAVSAVYAYHVRDMDTDMMTQQIEWYSGLDSQLVGSDVLNTMFRLNPLTRGLAQYALGLGMVYNTVTVSAQRVTYFWGAIYQHGSYSKLYFPLLYLTKMALGLIVLNLVVLKGALRRLIASSRRDHQVGRLFSNAKVLMLILFVSWYGIVALNTEFQIGIRHCLPPIVAGSILTAVAVWKYWEINIWRRVRVAQIYAFCLASIVFSTVFAFPHYLSYYNVLGGGTDHGYDIAVDSNYDWGQDLKRLGNWVDQNSPEIVYVDLLTNSDIGYYLGEKGRGLDVFSPPPIKSGDYLAVSAHCLQFNRYTEQRPGKLIYDDPNMELVQRVGKSIFLFQML